MKSSSYHRRRSFVFLLHLFSKKARGSQLSNVIVKNKFSDRMIKQLLNETFILFLLNVLLLSKMRWFPFLQKKKKKKKNHMS